MGDLNITSISKEQAEHLNSNEYDISLKLDGTLIYYINGELISPRCNRSDRFKHILKILKEADMPNCVGEMFVDEKGSCVFDVSRKENWAKCKFMIFDLLEPYNKMYYFERLQILNDRVEKLNNPFIYPMIKFKTFDEGWKFVVDNNCEGLVVRNNTNWFKCKLLKEEKIEIVAHEVGRDKGTFILKNGSRISGTSIQFVSQYLAIQQKGKKAIAEIEFCFYTDEGKMFQPRLRQIVEVEK